MVILFNSVYRIINLGKNQYQNFGTYCIYASIEGSGEPAHLHNIVRADLLCPQAHSRHLDEGSDKELYLILYKIDAHACLKMNS